MLAKLTITVLDADAIDPGRGLPETIEAQYNPTELTLQKSAQIGEQNIPGLDSPILQFVRGDTEKLTVTLLLDEASASGPEKGVEAQVTALYQLVKVQPRTHAVPRVEVTWGAAFRFVGVADSVQRKFSLFDPDGARLRAEVTISFREYRTLKEQLEELNLQSSDHTRVIALRAGDRLDTVAFREYGSSTYWKDLAAHNRVEDPRDLVPGSVIELPPLNELVRRRAR